MTDAKVQVALARYKMALAQLCAGADVPDLPLATEAIAAVLIAKGVMTKLEFYEALATAAEKALPESPRATTRTSIVVN